MKDANPMEDYGSACLFVYGTLRKGQRSHELLVRLRARLVASGHVRGRLYDLGEYPGAVESTGDRDLVFGEVYHLPRALQSLRILDKFEGFDPAKSAFNQFERRQASIALAGGGETTAWIYWLSGARQSGRCLPSGNYAKYRP